MNPVSLKAPEMNGCILMVNLVGLHNVMMFVQGAKSLQFSVRPEENGSLMLCVPVTKELEEYAPGALHGARARAKDKENPTPKPPTGGGDNTPPSGGTPGNTSVWQQTFTEAKAA
jgi:hypothetical protein